MSENPAKKPAPVGNITTPTAEVKPGGTAKVTRTRKPPSNYIQLLARIDRLLAAEDKATAQRCLTLLAGQYGLTIGGTPLVVVGNDGSKT